MNKIRENKILIFIVILSMTATFCTYNKITSKDPDFKIESKLIQPNLEKIISFEHVTLTGTETNSNGKISSKLVIQTINGINIPSDDSEMKQLGKSIATQFKQELKDPNEYNSYHILFIRKVTTGVVSSDKSTELIYNSVEL